jgi:glucan biosynthesis protein C
MRRRDTFAVRPAAPVFRGSGPFIRTRLLLACGVAAPLLALASTLMATAVYPSFNHARQYLSELGGASAGAPLIFNAGVFAAGFLAALAGVGFGLAIAALTRARFVGGLTVAVFVLAGGGMTRAALYPWPDPRHLAINLALGIQLAPLLLLWGLWPRRDLRGLKLFLAAAFLAMAALTLLTKHLVLPRLVNDFNVGWWERGYAIILVGWVGVAAFWLERRLRQESPASKTA